jgi:F0F1-type ATP synthase beta subunit
MRCICICWGGERTREGNDLMREMIEAGIMNTGMTSNIAWKKAAGILGNVN